MSEIRKVGKRFEKIKSIERREVITKERLEKRKEHLEKELKEVKKDLKEIEKLEDKKDKKKGGK